MKESFYKGSIGSLKEFWEDRGRTGSFERGYHIRLEGISSIVRKAAELIDGKRIPDIGCGLGIAASLFPTNTQVIGLDFSISMLRSARNRIQYLIRGDAFNLPFPNGVFEAATCLFLASDYSSKEGIFSEAHRILEKRGLLLFSDYSPNDEHWILKRRMRPLLGESCNIFIECGVPPNQVGKSGVQSASHGIHLVQPKIRTWAVCRIRGRIGTAKGDWSKPVKADSTWNGKEGNQKRIYSADQQEKQLIV